MSRDTCQVFISYRHVDEEAASHLFRLLKARNVVAWYDRLIAPGSDWREAIVERLSEARVMVILLSAAALESDELKKELAVAAQENVPLLTVRLEEVKPRRALAYELARGNWFDVFPDREARLQKLAAVLEERVANPGEILRRPGTSPTAGPKRPGGALSRISHLLLDPTWLAVLLAVVSTVEFALYERAAGPLENLTEAGVGPLTAIAYVTVAVTVGSPLLVILGLRDGVDLPLLGTAALNTLILLLLARASVRWIGGRLRRPD